MINVFNDIVFQYGNLIEVKSPFLIERYNRALKHLTGEVTNLSSFHIDCAGFSPEVADELGDYDYLNIHGVNKRFILITMKQLEIDIARTHFSSSMHMLKSFYRDNKKALTSLTASDVVFGELDNKQFKAKNVLDMLISDTIYISAETSKGIVEKSKSCEEKVNSVFCKGNWKNDELLNEIIELSKDCGNIIKNTPVPQKLTYKRENYYTTLFGGMYVFNINGQKTVLTEDVLFNPLENCDDVDALNEINFMPLDSKNKVYQFLIENKLIERVPFDTLTNRVDEFELKLLHSVLDEYLIDTHSNKEFSYLNQTAVKTYIAENYDHLPDRFYHLERFVSALNHKNKAEAENKKYQEYFHKPSSHLSGPDYALVSHLICHFKKHSYLSAYIYNRTLFEKRFSTWSEHMQNYVKTYLYDHSNVLTDLKRYTELE